MAIFQNKVQRLDGIKSKLHQMLERNRDEVGSGKTITEIETNILSKLLGIGKMMVRDRLLEEETLLESTGYDIESESTDLTLEMDKKIKKSKK